MYGDVNRKIITNSLEAWSLAGVAKRLSFAIDNMNLPIANLVVDTPGGGNVNVFRHGDIEIWNLKSGGRTYFNVKILRDDGTIVDGTFPSILQMSLVVKDSSDNIVFFVPTSTLSNQFEEYLYKRDKDGNRLKDGNGNDIKVCNPDTGYWEFDSYIYAGSNPPYSTHPIKPPYIESGRIVNAQKWNEDLSAYETVDTTGYYFMVWVQDGLSSLYRTEFTDVERLAKIWPRWYAMWNTEDVSHGASVSDFELGGHKGIDNLINPQTFIFHVPYFKNEILTDLVQAGYPPIGYISGSVENYSYTASYYGFKSITGQSFTLGVKVYSSVKFKISDLKFYLADGGFVRFPWLTSYHFEGLEVSDYIGYKWVTSQGAYGSISGEPALNIYTLPSLPNVRADSILSSEILTYDPHLNGEEKFFAPQTMDINTPTAVAGDAWLAIDGDLHTGLSFNWVLNYVYGDFNINYKPNSLYYGDTIDNPDGSPRGDEVAIL